MCFSVCIYMVGNVIFLVGHLHWCPCFFTRGVLRGSMLYVLSFLLRAASSVPVGCWPLYFLSWRIFCVACYCWRRLGGEKVRILMTSFKHESQKDLLITLKRLVWLKHPVQKLQPLKRRRLLSLHQLPGCCLHYQQPLQASAANAEKNPYVFSEVAEGATHSSFFRRPASAM